MHSFPQKKLFLGFLILVLAAPVLVWAASGDPSIDKVTISAPYGKGVEFSITVRNFGDLAIGNLEVIFPDQKKAQVTSKKEKTIKGVVPDDVLPQGGNLTVALGKKTAEYDLKIPYITQTFTPEDTKSEDLIIISGENFEPVKCSAALEKQKLKIQKCDYTQILVKIEKTLAVGNLYVTSYGFTSAPYEFKVSAPVISYTESVGDLAPKGKIRIYGSGFKSGATGPEVKLDKTKLELLSFSEDGRTIEAKLPPNSFSGKIVVTRGGLESNGVRLESAQAPILTSYSEERDSDGKMILTLRGKNFSATASENSVMLGKSKSSVMYAEETQLIAPLPTNIAEGCLSVTTKSIQSNCLYYAPKDAPILYSIAEPVLGNESDYTVVFSGSGFGDKINTTAYIKKSKQEIVGILGDSSMTIRFKSLPKSGTGYVVSNGVKSNEVEFDWSDIGVPFINKITAPQGFSPGQPVTIEGVNFERNANRSKVKINLNNGGISTQDFRTDPLKISTYFDYKATLYKETTLAVTVNGKKSNVLTFSFDPKLTVATAGPVIKKLTYPEGITQGGKIIIEGNGFASSTAANTVFFKDQQTVATEVKGSKLTVPIPAGAVSGKLYVEANGQKSNELPYLTAAERGKAFEIGFGEQDKNSFDINESKKKEMILAKLNIQNRLGHIKVKKLVFDIAFKDDIESQNSIRKTGVLPLGEIQLENKSVKGFIVAPAIASCGQGKCQVTFKNFILPPAAEKQTYDISTTVSASALNESQITLSLSPNNIEAENLERSDNNKADFSNLETISSPALTIYNLGTTCFDSQEDRRNCNALQTNAPSLNPVLSEAEGLESGSGGEFSPPKPAAEPEPQTPSSPVAPASPSPVTAEKRLRAPLVYPARTGGPLIPFRDAAEVPWAQKYVNAMKSKLIVTTMKDNLFRPKDTITRGDFVTYALSAFQIDLAHAGLDEMDLSDTESPLTRVDAVKILLLAGAFDIKTTQNPFTDLKKDQISWVAEAFQRGIVRGASATKFEPDRSVTRAEAAKMIVEAVEQYVKEVK